MSLLDPLAWGPRTARNRVVFGPHETNLGRRRALSDRHVAYYRRRAEGGAGVIVVEEASVHPSDWPYERSPLASDCAEGWAAIAAACHGPAGGDGGAGGAGPLVLAALGHAGGQGSSAYSQAPLLAPSRVPEVNTREVPKWMEAADIAAVVAGFGAAARLAVDAGCDGVEVNAGQHSLVRQFLSGLTNQRDDEWGTDKLRFARDVLGTVREAVGDGGVVGLRLSCDELAPWAGLTPEAAFEVALALAPLVHHVTVVRGSIYSASATRPDGHVAPGFNLDLARQVRAALPAEVVVVAQGSIVDVDMAAGAVEGGACDAVEMTRAQLADARLVAKLAAGEAERIRPCILCNQTCQVRDARNPIVTCVVDPRTGHETTDVDVDEGPAPAARPTDVLVVGAGPAGLEAARVAARLGHRVTVAEQGERLGGMVPVAARGSGRERLAAATDWLSAECDRLGVKVETGRRVRPDDLAGAPGAVLLCTGSRRGRHDYRVDERATVLTAADVLAAGGDRDGAEAAGDGPTSWPPPAALPQGPVLVWDPIGGPIGISVAERLRADGREVVLATPDLIAGNELSRSGDLAPANVRLQSAGVVLARRTLLRAVRPGTVEVEDRFTGERRTVVAVAVVDAGHRLPDDELWRRGGGRWPAAGDAVAPRTIHEAILEGRRRALALGAGAP
ncbi:MAG TPA: mycofactocin system FadH/OYE family oxidoreductase 1 [Acidimicrobiales bacterium]|nr:mycofactocin system FadH/OYE family oxidoreductase 1 [Acidimicrobiales bacterium]